MRGAGVYRRLGLPAAAVLVDATSAEASSRGCSSGSAGWTGARWGSRRGSGRGRGCSGSPSAAAAGDRAAAAGRAAAGCCGYGCCGYGCCCGYGLLRVRLSVLVGCPYCGCGCPYCCGYCGCPYCGCPYCCCGCPYCCCGVLRILLLLLATERDQERGRCGESGDGESDGAHGLILSTALRTVGKNRPEGSRASTQPCGRPGRAGWRGAHGAEASVAFRGLRPTAGDRTPPVQRGPRGGAGACRLLSLARGGA